MSESIEHEIIAVHRGARNGLLWGAALVATSGLGAGWIVSQVVGAVI